MTNTPLVDKHLTDNAPYGHLFVVPTPIGNLKDLTLRALEVLQSCDMILTEDTRTTGVLTSHYKINTPRQAFHLHNEHRVVNQYITRLKEGKKIALVSDAGTPGIADPGYLLIKAAITNQIDVTTLPGATALIPALVNSGLPCDRFYFEGFLPHKKRRQTRLQEISQKQQTVVIYESPHRIIKTLEQLIEHCGPDRMVAISREISKKFEETLRGNLEEVSIQVKNKEQIKGEWVLCLASYSKKKSARV